MADTDASPYHHGDLRPALVAAATDLLERGEPFSLRAVARTVGVSAGAPYRHFGDREELESAVAVDGFKDLHGKLSQLARVSGEAGGLSALAVAYVRFALDHPAVFRLMFGKPCNDSNDERVTAARGLQLFLQEIVAQYLPGQEVASTTTALWSLAHGLAFLHLDGKFPYSSFSEVEERVHTAFGAILGERTTPQQRPGVDTAVLP